MSIRMFTQTVADAADVAQLRDGTRSRDRVRDLAEVFTQPREFRRMWNLVLEGDIADDTPDEDLMMNPEMTVLEPACGDGVFLREALARKLRHITHHCLPSSSIILALSSIYGIDISARNVEDAQEYLVDMVEGLLDDPHREMVAAIINANIVCGDFLRATGGVVRTSPAFRKLKATDQKIFGIDAADDEDIRFLRIGQAGQMYSVGTFTLRDRRVRDVRIVGANHLAAHIRSR